MCAAHAYTGDACLTIRKSLECAVVLGCSLFWYFDLCRVDDYASRCVGLIAEWRVRVGRHGRSLGRCSHAVEVVNLVLLVVVMCRLQFCAITDANLGVCLEGVLDELCGEESGVDATVVGGVEGVGIADVRFSILVIALVVP